MKKSSGKQRRRLPLTTIVTDTIFSHASSGTTMHNRSELSDEDDIVGMLGKTTSDDASLLSNHGLEEVKDEDYWFASEDSDVESQEDERDNGHGNHKGSSNNKAREEYNEIIHSISSLSGSHYEDNIPSSIRLQPKIYPSVNDAFVRGERLQPSAGIPPIERSFQLHINANIQETSGTCEKKDNDDDDKDDEEESQVRTEIGKDCFIENMRSVECEDSEDNTRPLSDIDRENDEMDLAKNRVIQALIMDVSLTPAERCKRIQDVIVCKEDPTKFPLPAMGEADSAIKITDDSKNETHDIDPNEDNHQHVGVNSSSSHSTDHVIPSTFTDPQKGRFTRTQNLNTSFQSRSSSSQPYPSPRKLLAQKCLHNALNMMKRNESHKSVIQPFSEADVHGLTKNEGGMLKHEKQREEQREYCVELREDELVEREDQSDALSVEDRLENMAVTPGCDPVSAPSLVSYIGSVHVDLIDRTTPNPKTSPDEDSRLNLIQFIGRKDPLSTDSDEIHIISDNSESSYVGTLLDVGNTPIKNETMLHPQDRVSNGIAPLFKTSERLDDIPGIETIPTADETLSIKESQSAMLGSNSIEYSSSDDVLREGQSINTNTLPSREVSDEGRDALSPLPTRHDLGFRKEHSPMSGRSYTASNISASVVSDIFGLLRGYNGPSQGSSTCPPNGNEIEYSSPDIRRSKSLPVKSDEKKTSQPKIKRRSASLSTKEFGFLGNALIATNIFTPPKVSSSKSNTPSSAGCTDIRAAYKRSDQAQLCYDSIGATSSLQRAPPSRPQSLVFSPISPTKSSFSGFTEIAGIIHQDKQQQEGQKRIEITLHSIENDIEASTGDAAGSDANTLVNGIQSNPSLLSKSSREEMTLLEIAEEMEEDMAAATDTTRDEIAALAERVRRLEEESLRKDEKVNSLQDNLDVGDRSADNCRDTNSAEISKRVKLLEQRLEEEIENKEVVKRNALLLWSDLKSLTEEKHHLEKCLRSEISNLKSQLACVKVKNEHAESDKNAALKSVADLGLECKKKDEVIEALKVSNKNIFERQAVLEADLLEYAQSNDKLRSRLLELASDDSTKGNTLHSALSQLKLLSEKYYQLKEQLGDQIKGRQDEVSSLQFSLDCVSRQMVVMSSKVNIFEIENADLRDAVKRLNAEKQQAQRMHRSSKGA